MPKNEEECEVTRLTVRLSALLLLAGVLTACGSKPGSADPGSQPAPTTSQESQSAPRSQSISDIRKAAEEAGYTVSDDYVDAFMEDVTGGFAVEVHVDDVDAIYSVLECGTEEVCITNAQLIDEAGRNVAVRRGRILSNFSSDLKGTQHEAIITSIVEGKPLPKP